MNIRKATIDDLSRVAEILVFNNRTNFLPIFKDEEFSFGEMQVVHLVNDYFSKKEVIENLFVYDDKIIKGFVLLCGTEIQKLYVDTFFQNEGIGDQLINFVMDEYHANHLWALEKNVRAIAFYKRHGFHPSGEKTFEEGTVEYLVELVR